MTSIRFRSKMIALIIIACAGTSPSRPKDAAPTTSFRDYVDMKTFMEHVLGPAAAIVWKVNAVVIDQNGEHDMSPKSDKDWEQVVSGAATLAEATNALMIPQRVRDPSWIPYVRKLADAADKAYRAAEAHDLNSISEDRAVLDGISAPCHHHYGLE